MTPTPEQEAILTAARDTTDNLLIAALAGAAKTSTLVMIDKALPSTPKLCLAFNKRIADEMQKRLSGTCEARTLNSLGHRVWAQATAKRLRIETSKNYTILKGIVDELPKARKEAAYADFGDTLKIIDDAKTTGWVPDGHYEGHARRLMDDDEFFAWLDEEPSDLQMDLVRSAMLESIKQAYAGLCDYGDQLYMPTIFPARFPVYPLVLVDEAQDLSALNHAMLRKLVKKRLIAVGDECQSIYGFRGAHEDSMHLLEETFNMRKMILSISFRCPIAVVKAAQWRAPHMRWPEWAKEGKVEHKSAWGLNDLPERATIICRNNAPIFGMAIRLLKAGRYAEIVGNDIGKNLIKTMKKFGPLDMPQSEVFVAIEHWKAEKAKRHRNPARLADQAECLMIFAREGKNLHEAIVYAEGIINAAGTILMMTGHKSKGLEFDEVFILDRHLVRTDQHRQEENLLYVMQTRAKERLVYVNSEEFVDV